MKLKSILSTSVLVTFAALSISTQAASDTDKAPEAKAPVTSEQTTKPASTKRHSHVEEKTGMPQTISEAMPNKPTPAKAVRHLF